MPSILALLRTSVMNIIAAIGSRRGHGPGGGGGTPIAPYLYSITISGPTAGVVTYATNAYTAVGRDQNGDVFAFTPIWESASPSIATINSGTGVATPVSAGSAAITAKATNSLGSLVRSNAITLTGAARQVTTVVLAGGATSVIATHTTTAFTATAKDQNGTTMTGQAFVFSSSSVGVATIASSGVATGVSAGSTNIKAVCAGINSNLIALTVAAQVPTSPIVVSPSSFTIAAGLTQALTATVSDQGSPANVISGASVAWSSSALPKATVNGSGVVTGVAAGSATITATSGSATGTSAATITTPSTPTSITVAPSSVSMSPGGTQQLVVTDNLGNDVTSQCTFSINTKSVATIDAPTLTGVSPNTLAQGATSQDLTLTGTNFTSAVAGQSVVFVPGTGVTVNSTTFNSALSITANVSISGSAATGAGTIQVQDTNHGNSQTQPFTVTGTSPGFHWAWSFQEADNPITGSLPSYVILVSDPSNGTNPFPFPQTASGKPNWGLYGFSGTDHTRTRNPALGQLGGMESQANIGTQATLQVAVPAGTFDMNVALGDINNGGVNYCYLYDTNMTLVASVAGISNAGGRVVNIAGTSVTTAAWSFGTGKISATLPAGNLYVKFGSPAAQTGFTSLVTFELQQTA